MSLSKFSNRPANAVAGERDDLLAHLQDGVSLGPHSPGAHWFAPLLKKQSQFSAELPADENEARTTSVKIYSPRRNKFLSGTKTCL
jgi:hypothetical protein